MDLKIEKDVIKKIYYGGVENLKNNINEKEYRNISKKIRKIESQILENMNGACRERMETYMEFITARESIEAEYQFKEGFKTAIKLIIEVFEKE